MKDLIKLLRAKSLFEITRVSLTGNTVIRYVGTSSMTSSFVFVMQTRDKALLALEPIQVPTEIEDASESKQTEVGILILASIVVGPQ